jgi:hypothetical protein
MKIEKIILILFVLVIQLNSALAITIFDPKRGIEAPKSVKKVINKKNKRVLITPLYMKLVGISKFSNNYEFKLFDVQRKKKVIINWNTDMKDQVILKDFYKIDRVEYVKRSLILIPKVEVTCIEKRELNLLCNKNNEFVLTLTRNKPTPSIRKVKTKGSRKGVKRTNNPFANAIKNK